MRSCPASGFLSLWPRSSLAAAAATCAASVGWAQPVRSDVAPPVEPDVRQWPGAAIGGHRLAPFFAAAAQRRADVIGLGDSNHVFNSHGWEHGWNAALAARAGVYGTGLISLGENAGNGSGIGYRCGTLSTIASGAFIYADAGPPFDALMNVPMTPNNANYVYLPRGATAPSNAAAGLSINSDSPVRASGHLRFQLVFGRFEGSTALLRPVIRLNDPPYSALAEFGPVPMFAPTNDVGIAEFQIQNTPPPSAVALLLARPGAPAYESPLLGLYASADDPDRLVGHAYHVLYFRGGHSLLTMANTLNTIDPSQVRLFLSLAGGGQRNEAGPIALVRINSGLNDLRTNEPSFVGGFVPGSSPEAFADNLRAVIDSVKTSWAAAGFADESLYFLLTASHPIAGLDGQLLERYADVAASIALSMPRAACVRVHRLTDPEEMLRNNWYRLNGADTYHLNQPAYIELAERELEALERWCPGDWTGDTSFDSEDIAVFLADWERGEGDVNRDGNTDSDDIVLFFQKWDAANC